MKLKWKETLPKEFEAVGDYGRYFINQNRDLYIDGKNDGYGYSDEVIKAHAQKVEDKREAAAKIKYIEEL